MKDSSSVNEIKASDTFVQSLAKGLAVISSFSAERQKQTLSDVAKVTGLTRAGARRLLLTLEQLGYVVQDNRLFSLTPKVLNLGFSYLSSIPFSSYAQPILEQMAREAKESCSISVLDGTDIIYVLRVPTHKIMSITLSIGSRLPACYTAMGRMLLAGVSEAELDSVLDKSELKKYTEYTLVDREQIKQTIREAKEKGWVSVGQELEMGLFALSAPICNQQGKVIASLNISGNAFHYNNDLDTFVCRFLDLLLTKAKEISTLTF